MVIRGCAERGFCCAHLLMCRPPFRPWLFPSDPKAEGRGLQPREPGLAWPQSLPSPRSCPEAWSSHEALDVPADRVSPALLDEPCHLSLRPASCLDPTLRPQCPPDPKVCFRSPMWVGTVPQSTCGPSWGLGSGGRGAGSVDGALGTCHLEAGGPRTLLPSVQWSQLGLSAGSRWAGGTQVPGGMLSGQERHVPSPADGEWRPPSGSAVLGGVQGSWLGSG